MANTKKAPLSDRIARIRELDGLSQTLTDPANRTEARTHRDELLTEIIKHPRDRSLLMVNADLRRMILASESLSRLFIKKTDDEQLDSLKGLPFKGKADRDRRKRLGNGAMTPPRRAGLHPAHAS